MKANKIIWTSLIGFVSAVVCANAENGPAKFNPDEDLLSLHYDHAPDKDDGQSAAADRTVLESLFGRVWMEGHVVAVSGAYGRNADTFNTNSDVVMDAAWNDCSGWLSGHTNRTEVVTELSRRWKATLEAGGDVWVKEGGQSDITAAVVKRIRKEAPGVDTSFRIHVVQHSQWNEDQTTAEALEYTRGATDYIRIADANAYLNVQGGNASFEAAARAHPVFGPVWKAAFAYYDPNERLDFSDTGELFRILGLGEIGIDAFRTRFLEVSGSEAPTKPGPAAPAPRTPDL